MEFEFSSLTILVSIFMILLITFREVKKSRSETKSNVPPGPRKVPFIGHLHLFASSYAPHRILHDLSLKYGSLMHLQLGEITTLVSSSPESAKEFLKTHDETFAFRPSLLSTEILCYGNTDIAFAPYGEYWRQLRKICAIEVLSAKRVLSFRPIREEEFSNLCRRIASDEGLPVNLSERVTFTNYEVVTRASLGKKTKEQDTFISVIKEAVEMSSGFGISDVYPSVKLFQLFSGQRGKIEKVHKKADAILGNIINEHRAARDGKGTGECNSHEDLLDVLLKYQDAESELHLNELKYLKLVIRETLRLHPPVPLLLPRESSKPCEIDGYKLPFGAGKRICPGMSFGLANVELPLAMLLFYFDWVLPDGMTPEEIDMTESFGATSRKRNPLCVIPVVKKPLPAK